MTFADHYATKERWAAEYARLRKIGNRKDAKHAWERMHAANMAMMQMFIRSKEPKLMKRFICRLIGHDIYPPAGWYSSMRYCTRCGCDLNRSKEGA